MTKIFSALVLGLLVTVELPGQESKNDSIYCDVSNLYSVSDALLNQKLGSHQAPDQNPKYEEGLETLKDFFAKNSLADKRAKGMVFRVHIGFVVNCRGEAGHFEIVSEGKGDLKELGEEVLKIARAIPGKWIPASANGQSVDCHQVLSFTVAAGKLDRVTYR